MTASGEVRDDQRFRIFQINHSNHSFARNSVFTTKYNIFTFFPLFASEQFTKTSNTLFVVTASLNTIEGLAPTNKYATSLGLLFVLSVSAVKEVYEDWCRAEADVKANQSKTRKFESDGVEVPVEWDSVHVGDVIKVLKGEEIPADVIIVGTSEPGGLCYVETSNIDGETNLKIKNIPSALLELSDTIFRLKGRVVCEQPNSRIHSFEGRLELELDGQGEQVIPLSHENMIIRGARLRNTGHIYGLVTYTGHETKIMQNTAHRQIKITQMESIYNEQTVFLFILLLALTLTCFMCDRWFEINVFPSHYYIANSMNWRNTKDVLMRFLMFCLLYHNFVPINLNITVEVVRMFLGRGIGADDEMADNQCDCMGKCVCSKSDRRALCKTSTLVEELGQVRFVFSDKTGTLTRNLMTLKHMFCAGSMIDISKAPLANEIEDHQDKSHFLRALVSCHTVVIETGHEDDVEAHYQASSPDEAAIVSGAISLGWVFANRDQRHVYLRTPSHLEQWTVLALVEFTSERRRMSVVLRDQVSGKAVLYCKGADSIILDQKRCNERNPYITDVIKALEVYGREGMRTLCYAYRELDDDFLIRWLDRWTKALSSVEDRQVHLAIAADEIERDWLVVGATAVEDRLQEGVPETIEMLQEAGMCMWVLTGDRQETAINIGYSCRLLDANTLVEFLSGHDVPSVGLQLKKLIQSNPKDEALNRALVIDGTLLDHALDPQNAALFIRIACTSSSVICCRISPQQKAAVVVTVRSYEDGVTLAIGDGANDISMLQAAHIGVGISGREGLQAVRSSDFAISQFRFLQRLLLVHGNYSYHRLSKVFVYCLYKNILLYAGQLWYAYYHGFSGQSLYDGWMLSLYNVLFAQGPIIVLGVTEQYVQPEKLLRYPGLYKTGPQNRFFNRHSYWASTLNAFIQSFIIVWMVAKAFGTGIIASIPLGLISSTEKAMAVQGSMVMMGATIFAVSVVTITLKIFIIANFWTWLLMGLSSFCVVAWFIYLFLADFVSWNMHRPMLIGGISMPLLRSSVFWACLLLVPALCLSRDFLWKFYKRSYTPLSYHIIQELEDLELKHREPGKAVKRPFFQDFRGFGFSQTEGQTKILNQIPEFLSNPFRIAKNSLASPAKLERETSYFSNNIFI